MPPSPRDDEFALLLQPFAGNISLATRRIQGDVHVVIGQQRGIRRPEVQFFYPSMWRRVQHGGYSYSAEQWVALRTRMTRVIGVIGY